MIGCLERMPRKLTDLGDQNAPQLYGQVCQTARYGPLRACRGMKALRPLRIGSKEKATEAHWAAIASKNASLLYELG